MISKAILLEVLIIANLPRIDWFRHHDWCLAICHIVSFDRVSFFFSMENTAPLFKRLMVF